VGTSPLPPPPNLAVALLLLSPAQCGRTLPLRDVRDEILGFARMRLGKYDAMFNDGDIHEKDFSRKS
jgi:hypothetical protein